MKIRELRIGVDLGGTKIEAAALDRGGVIRWRRRVATPVGDYAATLAAIVELVQSAEREMGETGSVGIATPGARSLATGLMKNCNSTCLNGKPLQQDLEERLGREVRMANDANCFALSEAIDGAGRGAAVVFGVILGTGVGGGLVIHRRIVTGVNAIAGEWGHNPLPLPAASDLPLPACYCGRHGCIETYLSGPGFAADHAKVSGERVAADEIARRADAGDTACAATLERYAQRLARSLGIVINVLDPDVIVLGGGLSGIASLYARVPALWKAFVFSDEVRTRLAPPAHGDASGVRGAAWLWEIPFGAPPARGAAVTLREVDEANIDLVADIRVAPTQVFDVASVGKTFWQLKGRADAWVRAIYASEEPVGLVALIDKGAEAYIARLIVDAAHQGRGFGAEALRQVLEHARAKGCTSVRLSHMPANARVGRYYERFGFRHTGAADADGELEMRLAFESTRPAAP